MHAVNDEELAADLVRAAGTLAARMRRDGVEVEQKTHVSDIVTAADHAAERLVVDTLRRERPDDSIVGEEGADHVGTSGRTWSSTRSTAPTTSTAGWTGGARPSRWSRATTWCSVPCTTRGRTRRTSGGRAAVHRDGVALAPLEDRPLAECCATTYLHPPFYDGEVGAAFARAVGGVATLRMMGSGTMDAMAIAEGRCDVLFQHSVPDWDRLPGAALIRGVGGEARVVHAAGVDWYVAGVPTAVAEICAALTGA